MVRGENVEEQERTLSSSLPSFRSSTIINTASMASSDSVSSIYALSHLLAHAWPAARLQLSLLDLRHVHVRNLLLPDTTPSLASSGSSVFLATRPTRQRTVSTASRSSAASGCAARGRLDEAQAEGGAESRRMARLAARRRMGEAKVVLSLPRGSGRKVELKPSLEHRTHHQWSVGEEVWPADAVAARALGVELWLRASDTMEWGRAWSREAELEELRSIKLDVSCFWAGCMRPLKGADTLHSL